MNIPQLPPDKAAHAVMGSVIFTVAGGAAAALGAGEHSRYIGAFAAALAGAAKEASDYLLNRRAIARGVLPPHGVEFLDFAATVGGALFVWGAAIVTGA